MPYLCAMLLLIVLAIYGQAHMQLYHPPPFGAENNPHRTDPPDPYLSYPYNCCDTKTPFPCRGYLRLVGSPQGAPVASWEAGSLQSFSLTGSSSHYGGSCQVGFSVDNGASWRVITSYEGNCPRRDGGTDPAGQIFTFTVPTDTPAGNHVFAWTWLNREHEFFMVCSAVTITPKPAGPPAGHSVPFNDRPGFLLANLENGCNTPVGIAEVKYPHPGPDVVPGDGTYPLELPTPSDKCGY